MSDNEGLSDHTTYEDQNSPVWKPNKRPRLEILYSLLHFIRVRKAEKSFIVQWLLQNTNLTRSLLFELSEECLNRKIPFFDSFAGGLTDSMKILWNYFLEKDSTISPSEYAKSLIDPPAEIKNILGRINLGINPTILLIMIAVAYKRTHHSTAPLLQIEKIFYFHFCHHLSHALMELLRMFGFPFPSKSSRFNLDKEAAFSSVRLFILILLTGGPDLVAMMIRDNFQDSHLTRSQWQNVFLLTTVFCARFGKIAGSDMIIPNCKGLLLPKKDHGVTKTVFNDFREAALQHH